MSVSLPDSLRAWGSPAFGETLKQEVEQLAPRQLPLQQGLSRSSYATDRPHTAIVLTAVDEVRFIRAKVGLFYTGIIAGCSCADDPTPLNEENEYCEVQVQIDKETAAAVIALATEA